jgi:glycosyltransferase involved in cell wall biosynthesis
LPLVARQCPEVRLRIVGSGPYEPDLRQLATDLGVADRVEIKGVAGHDREAMAAILTEAKLAILLSNYESQGISVMEALSLGCPVLVADTTALGELAASGLARVTPLGSTPQGIAAAILGQLRQPLIPANAELPTWEACAGDIQNLYRRIIAERSECAC